MTDKTQLEQIEAIINNIDHELGYFDAEHIPEVRKAAQQILDICQPQWMDFNKLELQAEDLECTHLHLDDLNIPRHDASGKEYSIVGRINVAISLIRRSWAAAAIHLTSTPHE